MSSLREADTAAVIAVACASNAPRAKTCCAVIARCGRPRPRKATSQLASTAMRYLNPRLIQSRMDDGRLRSAEAAKEGERFHGTSKHVRLHHAREAGSIRRWYSRYFGIGWRRRDVLRDAEEADVHDVTRLLITLPG